MNWEMARYIIAGICTTLVNIGIFSVLKYGTGMRMQMVNIISILAAIAFAFVINKKFVFCKKSRDGLGKELLSFCSMRMISMGIEVLGMYGFTELSSVPDLAAKVVLQMIVIGMNYMISKLYIFREDKR